MLEDHGWILHRIWSTDWFQRPKEQLDRVIAAIEAAKAELDEREIAGAHYTRGAPVQIVTIDRADVTEIGLVEARSDDGPNLYVEHVSDRVRQALAFELHETPTSILAEMVATVVEVEEPVHLDEVTARIRSAWGLQRSGARIQACVEQAVTAAIGRGLITSDGDFLSIPFREPVVRDRSLTGSSNLRKIEMLPPSEIRAAALAIARDHLGATCDELVGAAAPALGVRAVSAQIREVVSQQIDRLLAEEDLTTQGPLLMMPSAAQDGPMPVQPNIAAVETV